MIFGNQVCKILHGLRTFGAQKIDCRPVLIQEILPAVCHGIAHHIGAAGSKKPELFDILWIEIRILRISSLIVNGKRLADIQKFFPGPGFFLCCGYRNPCFFKYIPVIKKSEYFQGTIDAACLPVIPPINYLR